MPMALLSLTKSIFLKAQLNLVLTCLFNVIGKGEEAGNAGSHCQSQAILENCHSRIRSSGEGSFGIPSTAGTAGSR